MYKARIEKVAQNMHKQDVSYMIVSSEDAIFYLTGHHIHVGERMIVGLIDDKGRFKLFVHKMFQCQLKYGDIHYFGDDDDPVEILSNYLSQALTIGVDKEWPSKFLLALMSYHQANYINGSLYVDDVRLYKDEVEQEIMRQSSNINDQAMDQVQQIIKTSHVTEREVQNKIVEIFSHLGADSISFTPIICFGKGASEPHHACDESRLVEGSVIIDMGCVYKGYCSDMTRSLYKGVPSDEYKRAYQAVLKANLNAISIVKPGVALSDVDRAARSVIETAGFGDYFVHRTGHGIGVNVHEYPDVSTSSQAICEEGMIFSIEPGIYIPDAFGIRIEDLVLVTKDGCEVLNHYSKELECF